ncbi:hypothetical protein GUITHDRAFT_41650, partial [Guillardia theta CCMP2712]
FRAFLYLLGLLWCFAGVSILSDAFMAGIERITNTTYKKRVLRKDDNGQTVTDDGGNPVYEEVENLIWNPAVANLTLMALGSSTPEILLAVIEICFSGFFSGDLGPGTVVGSASYNLNIITAVCMLALPAGVGRKVDNMTVFLLTSMSSVLAYLWMYISVSVWTPNVVTVEEAAVTFGMFPVLTLLVYLADRGYFSFSAKVAPSDGTKDTVAPDANMEQINARAKYRHQALGALSAAKPKQVENEFLRRRSSMISQDLSYFQFPAEEYSFLETAGEVFVPIVRYGNVDCATTVSYETVDGTAKAGKSYQSTKGTVSFAEGEVEKTIPLTIIHDDEWNEDLNFLVNLTVDDQQSRLGLRDSTKVTIIDMDGPGVFEWSDEDPKSCTTEDAEVTLFVQRLKGSRGDARLRVRTVDDTAKAGFHYDAIDAVLDWSDNEILKHLCFYAEMKLEDKDSGASVGQKSRIEIRISPADMSIEELTWSMQFRQALTVNGGENLEDTTNTELTVHYITFIWKFFAAFIPPPQYWNGWATFIVALVMIGLVTTLISDLASLFGCVVGLEDAVTAITIVALGTSLPDTFASMLAISSDNNADNAIGNITGSNSVNVYLGLGLPWLIAAIYWSSGGFVVIGGSLGFNTILFVGLTVISFAILFVRRAYFGFELGGPKWASVLSAVLFITIWIVYLVVNSLQVY